jgi:hypothetical protein
MSSIASPHLYVSCDLDDGQTLVEWRAALDLARRVTRRRRFRLPSLRLRLAH